MAGIFGTSAQVAPLRQTAIQPTGLPSSTFVRPQQAQAGGNALALANALGGLSTSLANYAAVSKVTEEDPQTRENKVYMARLQQMDTNQLLQEMQTGSHTGSRIREDAMSTYLGERMASDMREEWATFYNSDFDRTNGNAREEYERLRQRFAGGIEDEVARGNFYRLTNGHMEAWLEKDTEVKIDAAKSELKTTMVGSFANLIDDEMGLNKKGAGEAVSAVFRKLTTDSQFLGLSPQEQEQTLIDLANRYANAGNEDVVRQILSTPRQAADGSTVPALRDKPEFADKSRTLISTAETLYRQEAQKSGLDVFDEVNRLVTTGEFDEAHAEKYRDSPYFTQEEVANKLATSRANLARIRKSASDADQKRMFREDHDRARTIHESAAYEALGKVGGARLIDDVQIPAENGDGFVNVSRKELLDGALAKRESDFAAMEEQAIANKMEPAQAKRAVNLARLDFYAKQNLVNEDWKDQLNGIGALASLNTLADGGQVTDDLLELGALYRDLKENNPAYLSKLVTDPASKEFLEAYDIAITRRRLTPKDAMTYAAHRAAAPDSVRVKSMLSTDDTDKIATSVLRAVGADPDRSVNASLVRDIITDMSAAGATKSEIKGRVEEEVSRNAVVINGRLVKSHAELPHDYPVLMQDALAEWVTKEGGAHGIVSPSEVSLVAHGTEARWYVTTKDGRTISATPITPKGLESIRETKKAAADAEIRKLNQAKGKEREAAQQTIRQRRQAERDRISWWHGEMQTRGKLRKSVASYVYHQLVENMEQDLARDEQWARGAEGMKDATYDFLGRAEFEAWKERNK